MDLFISILIAFALLIILRKIGAYFYTIYIFTNKLLPLAGYDIKTEKDVFRCRDITMAKNIGNELFKLSKELNDKAYKLVIELNESECISKQERITFLFDIHEFQKETYIDEHGLVNIQAFGEIYGIGDCNDIQLKHKVKAYNAACKTFRNMLVAFIYWSLTVPTKDGDITTKVAS